MKSPFSHRQVELELVLRCARTIIDSECLDDIYTLLRNELDWSSVTQLAIRHGLVPLLYSSLISTFPECVPKDSFIQLKELYTLNLQSNIYLARELTKTCKNFSENEIQTIPYKGPILTKSIYGSLGLRQFGDLDIIVHARDVRRAEGVLISRGYIRTWPQIQLSEKQEDSHIRAKYNYQFISGEDEVSVELHWNITPRYFSVPRNPDWLWENLESITLYGKNFLTFSPEQYLIILCVHGSNHGWLRLSWICDINEIIQNNPSLKWGQLINESRSQGCERMLLLGVLLSHELLGTDLPEEIWERLNNQPSVNSLTKYVIHKFRTDSWVGSGIFEIPRFHLKARDNPQAQWHYLFSLTRPSVKDWSFIRLPSSLEYLYYLLRPIRLGVEYGIQPIIHQVTRILK